MEENKVATRDKLAAMRLPEDAHASAYPKLGYKWADAILQSPDLRVTLAEPRYYVDDGKPGYIVIDRETKLLLAEFVNGGARQQRANEYAAWLNSKESK
jgi:hypothetical protein